MKASYTFKSWDINGVPFPMILATHFYFTLYHTLGNMALRKTRSRFAPGRGRFLFECMLVFFMSYVTAFTEAFTISGFPCYSFSDRRMAWVLGSAFYGIYFIVSYPMFIRIDEPGGAKFDAWATARDALAAGMLVLQLLDAARLFIGADFKMAPRPCKTDASLIAHPSRVSFASPRHSGREGLLAFEPSAAAARPKAEARLSRRSQASRPPAGPALSAEPSAE
eukprot:CAMPEP_0113671324 /NCGR_PEP_ID=MMETSP0038_2-20120614/5642_1 /TAXON_ID=2898 /ORGANISM="Cryptomonas paramecium" /LENGTH=222 /DNA_ID=CAMNT_0000587465 /DNA_START=453 /DNA_END=1122 /DNA_ORIENTATION=+ /assembly_acc=CAM_ASM_000170